MPAATPTPTMMSRPNSLPAPDFQLVGGDGATVSLSSVLAENPLVVITFYKGYFCDICRAQISGLQEFYDEMRAEGAELLAISVDDIAGAQRMRHAANAQFPILADPTHSAAMAYGLFNLLGDGYAAPATILLDSNEMIAVDVGLNVGDYPSAASILDALRLYNAHGQVPPGTLVSANSSMSPTPSPNPAEYNIGLAYAEGQNLEQGDREVYATAFAQAKRLDLDNSSARTYADGVIFHAAYAMEQTSPEIALDYADAFEQVLGDDPSLSSRDAIGRVTETIRRERQLWPFDSDDGEVAVSFAEAYTNGLGLANASNLAAHGYALSYAGLLYTGNTQEESANRANAFALGYEQASSTDRCSIRSCPDLRERLAYAAAYEDGRIEASRRVGQGYTSERNVDAWADAYAEAYIATGVQEGSCGFRVYGLGYNLNFGYYTRRYKADAVADQWANSPNVAVGCARLVAYGQVDVGGSLGFDGDYPYKHAGAYYRGVHYASERGLSGGEADAYAYAYYLAYFRVRERWDEQPAHAYSIGYADAKRIGRTDEEAEAYASAYEEAYTSQKRNGASDEDAHAYAAAFAEARSGL